MTSLNKSYEETKEQKIVLKIALAQINPTIGAFEQIRQAIKHECLTAKGRGCDLIVFPELCITGYPPKDLLERSDFVEEAEKSLAILVEEIDGIGVLVGTVTKNRSGVGKPLYNSAVLFENGKIIATVHKQLLPTYDVFDEARYFRPGPKADPVSFRGASLGITICEDIWNEPTLCPHCETYDRDPVGDLCQKGAQLIINISSSPFSIGKVEVREKILSGIAEKYNVPTIYCNSVGGQDCLVFDGASVCFLPNKQCIARAYQFKSDLVFADLKTQKGTLRPTAASEEEQIASALILALRDYTRRCSIKKVTLGLSGGIDSSLTALLATLALGPDNVLGVLMPSAYTSKESIEDAKALADNLGIPTVTLSIVPVFQAYLDVLSDIFEGLPMNVAEENIQARIRGNLLMAISNKLGHMVLSTGNKSELAVGYCTLYGDMSGGYALISDLPKTMVYKVADFLNKQYFCIPKRVFEKPPSAELRPDQTDQDDLPPYEVLDPILELYMEQKLSPSQIVQHGFDKETVKRIVSLVDRNEYKRLQAPLGPKITMKAFCCGRRYPVAHGYRPN